MLRQPLTVTVLLVLAFGLAFAFLAVRGGVAAPDPQTNPDAEVLLQ